MTSGLCNSEYYRGVVLEIQKSMEMREEGMEVQEEAAYFTLSGSLLSCMATWQWWMRELCITKDHNQLNL